MRGKVDPSRIQSEKVKQRGDATRHFFPISNDLFFPVPAIHKGPVDESSYI